MYVRPDGRYPHFSTSELIISTASLALFARSATARRSANQMPPSVSTSASGEFSFVGPALSETIATPFSLTNDTALPAPHFASRTSVQKKPKERPPRGTFAQSGWSTSDASAGQSRGGTYPCRTMSEGSSSSLCPSMTRPVVEASFPTRTAVQALASMARPKTATADIIATMKSDTIQLLTHNYVKTIWRRIFSSIPNYLGTLRGAAIVRENKAIAGSAPRNST